MTKYKIILKSDYNEKTPIEFNIILSDEQLNGIISFIYLYGYDRYIEKKGEYPPTDILDIKSIDGQQINTDKIENNSDLGLGHLYSNELANIITYDDKIDNGYTLLYRILKTPDVTKYKLLQLPTQEIIDNYIKKQLKYRYFAIFISNYDFVLKQFNTPEYIQGFISMANWLHLDYSKYIMYIFDGKILVVID